MEKKEREREGNRGKSDEPDNMPRLAMKGGREREDDGGREKSEKSERMPTA